MYIYLFEYVVYMYIYTDDHPRVQKQVPVFI